MNDKIFSLTGPLSEDYYEPLEDWSRCNNCGESNKKLKNCTFCGELNCTVKCLVKQRAYPMHEVDQETGKAVQRRGEICVVCNTKLLYRDAMSELMAKL